MNYKLQTIILAWLILRAYQPVKGYLKPSLYLDLHFLCD